jgi:hypothetical protein
MSKGWRTNDVRWLPGIDFLIQYSLFDIRYSHELLRRKRRGIDGNHFLFRRKRRENNPVAIRDTAATKVLH